VYKIRVRHKDSVEVIPYGKGRATNTCILYNSRKILSIVATLAIRRASLLDYPCPTVHPWLVQITAVEAKEGVWYLVVCV
jgi:hypothetical protein